MLSRRIVQLSSRHLAALNRGHASELIASQVLSSTYRPSIDRRSQIRKASTEQVSSSAEQDILAQQRLRRPVSPNLTIYKPQITWYMSGLNRITGSVLSGGLYIFGSAYVVAPLFGWHLESASMAAAFAAWPLLAKVALKFSIAMPFTFHSFNGVRHLVWDTGREFTNAQVIKTGWAVVGLSVVSAIGLAFI